MKKLFLKTITALGICAPIASTMSCGFEMEGSYLREKGNIYFITDAFSVKDKSFNEFILKGVQNFTKLSDNDKTYSYIMPPELEEEHIQKAYEIAISKGAETIVLSGFNHTTVGKVNEFAKKHPDIAFIGVDTFVQPGEDQADNLQNLDYSTHESGFLSAVYSAIFLNENQEKYRREGQDHFIFSAFGGIKYTSVTQFMDGWLQGVRFFNDNIKIQPSINQNQQRYIPIKYMLVDKDATTPSENDFSGDFNPGTATSKSEELIKNGAQVILAVAASQTGDLIGAIKSSRLDDVFAVGCDTDQSLLFESKYMIGSALKGIDKSVTIALEDLYSGTSTKQGHGVGRRNQVKFKDADLTRKFEYKKDNQTVDFGVSSYLQYEANYWRFSMNRIYKRAILHAEARGVERGIDNPITTTKLPKNITEGYYTWS